MKVAINGFGRIGRSILRLAMRSTDVDVVLVNDVAPLATCAYLFEYDSIHGVWHGDVRCDDADLVLDGRRIRFHSVENVGSLDLRSIDVLLECSGRMEADRFALDALSAGARRVLVSGPASWAETTIVLGANEHRYRGERIVSNASCTTNALAPLLRILDDRFGIVGGHMTTVHCYTASQPTVDQPRDDLARSRAAALSMVPTTTSAHRLLRDVLPQLDGLIEARALRVPSASVSALDLTVSIRSAAVEAEIRSTVREAIAASPVLGWIEKPLVSSDLRGRLESLVVSGPETSMSAGRLLRMFGWYDNEYGFASRMLDMATLMSGSSASDAAI